MPQDFDTALETVLAKDPRFPREAYHFVREALDHTQRAVLTGIRDVALEQFGPMACCVLEDWGVKRCEDFGDLVFNLVEHEILSKTEQDSRDDFKGGYDFTEAFRRPFIPAQKDRPDGCPE